MPEVCSESARGGKEEFWKKVKRYFLLCGPPVHGSIAKTTARPHVRPHGARWYRHPSRRSTRALPSRRRNRRRRARRCTVAPTHLAQCGWRRGGPEQRAPLLRASRAIMMSHQHRHRRLCTCRTNRGPGGSLPCEPSWSRLQFFFPVAVYSPHELAKVVGRSQPWPTVTENAWPNHERPAWVVSRITEASRNQTPPAPSPKPPAEDRDGGLSSTRWGRPRERPGEQQAADGACESE